MQTLIKKLRKNSWTILLLPLFVMLLLYSFFEDERKIKTSTPPVSPATKAAITTR